jgi:DNA-binding response OmpR family regulator
MDTHAEFRLSERRTLLIRLAVVAGALAFGLSTGGSIVGVAALVAGFGLYTAVLQFLLLPRFQSDAWIYGMVGADMVFAGAATAVLGAPGPAVTIPALFVAQHALFLGYRGAGVSAILGITTSIGGAVVAGADLLDSLSVAVPVIAGSGAISGFIASDRFAQRSARRTAERGNDSDTRAARMLDGLKPIASANDEASALEAFARSILTVTSFDGVAIYTRSGGLGLQRRVVLSRDGDEATKSASADFEESIHGESAAARAASQGVALALGGTEPLPGWATRSGYSTGVVAPMVVGHLTAGVAFGLSHTASAPTLELIDQMERFVSLSARLVAAHNSGAQPAARNRLSLELDAAGRAEIGESRPIIKVDGLTLDPATDRSSVIGVPVSLSRSEFDLLYVLASSPGQIIDPGSLIESAFGDASDSGQRTVDATIYRLRRKLSRAPSGEDLIKTVRGKGYLLVPPVAESQPGQVAEAISAD